MRLEIKLKAKRLPQSESEKPAEVFFVCKFRQGRKNVLTNAETEKK